ncbi:MAG: hypothetical protein MZU84_01340 [Sphingobacterium sp.]|nr:hypothetical protein [Sphingobacterium sp.]
MITLEQVRALEARVEKALSVIDRLTAENAALPAIPRPRRAGRRTSSGLIEEYRRDQTQHRAGHPPRPASSLERLRGRHPGSGPGATPRRPTSRRVPRPPRLPWRPRLRPRLLIRRSASAKRARSPDRRPSPPPPPGRDSPRSWHGRANSGYSESGRAGMAVQTLKIELLGRLLHHPDRRIPGIHGSHPRAHLGSGGSRSSETTRVYGPLKTAILAGDVSSWTSFSGSVPGFSSRDADIGGTGARSGSIDPTPGEESGIPGRCPCDRAGRRRLRLIRPPR